MRSTIITLLLSLSVSLTAQDCITVTPIDTIFDTENYAFSTLIVNVVREDGSNSSGWTLESDIPGFDGLQGSYGQVTLGPIPCTGASSQRYYYRFFDQVDSATCDSNNKFYHNAFCEQASCQRPSLFWFGGETCDLADLSLRVINGIPPLDVVVTTPSGTTEAYQVDPIERRLRLGHLTAPGRYTARLTTVNGCVAEESTTQIDSCTTSLTGYSWLDENGNGLRDQNEPPVIAEVYIEARNFNRENQTVTTDSLGRYQFTNLPASRHYLIFTPQTCVVLPTLQDAGNDENRDSDIFNSRRVDITLEEGEAASGLADAGWTTFNCPLNVTTQDPLCNSDAGSIIVSPDCAGAFYQLFRDDTGVRIATSRDGEFFNIAGGGYRLRTSFYAGCSFDTTITLIGENNLAITNEGDLCDPNTPTIQLTAPEIPCDEGAVSYIWNTGETTPSILVSTPGSYAVTISSTDGTTYELSTAVDNEIELPLAPSYQTDCATGEARIELPAEYADADVTILSPFAVQAPRFEDGAIVASEQLDSIRIEFPDGECLVFAETQVVDGYLDNLTIERLGANCSDVLQLRLLEGTDSLSRFFNEDNSPLTINWSGPGIIENTPGNTYGQVVIDGTPGLYQAEVTSYCGTRTLTYQFAEDDAACESITGRSWLDENENGIRDANEPPVFAEVSALEFATGNFYTTITDSDGVYTFSNLAPGDYEIRFAVETCELRPTLRNAGDDENQDSDIDTTGATIITLPINGSSTGLADAGWRQANCAVDVTVVHPVCNRGRGEIGYTSNCGGGSYELRDVQGEIVRTNTPGRYTFLDAGGYILTYTYGDGCIIENYVELVGIDDPALAITTQGTLCSLTPEITLTAPDQALGEEVLSYSWSNGETTRSITVTEGTTYEVDLTLASGCAFTLSSDVSNGDVRLPLAEEYLTDCATGEARIELPAEYAQVDIQFTSTGVVVNPRFEDGAIIFSEPGLVSFEFFTGNCRVFGETVVVDGDLANLSIFTGGTNCSDVTSLEVVDANGVDWWQNIGPGPNQYTITWSGPGTITPTSVPSLVDIDGTPGVYQAEITSYCGQRTLTYRVGTNPNDCGNGGDTSSVTTFSARLVQAEGNDCATGFDMPNNLRGIPGVTIEVAAADGSVTYLYRTDELGQITDTLPGGTDYQLRAINLERKNLSACEPSVTITGGQGNQQLVLTAISDEVTCADLDVSVVSNRFRRCFENNAAVRFGNYSGVPAVGAELTVHVDSLFEDITASIPFTRAGNILTFAFGELPAFFEAYVYLNFTISCEATLGQLHCLDAEFTAANQCAIDNGEALVMVEAGGCTGDSLSFRITNVGSRAMEGNLEYYVYEDGVQNPNLSVSRPPLGVLDTISLTLPADGRTVMVMARQTFNDDRRPRYPSATIAGCGGESPGFVTIGGDAGINGEYELCRTNTGSFDPNEKLVFPRGVNGMNNDIEPGTRLTYEIHFQNTGTDTAFTVVIRDTLPEALDAQSFELGATSHEPIDVVIENGRELVITFEDIFLVDSFTDVAASMGVVSFTIDHNTNLRRGDTFRNRAGIYFDFNEPIITEYANTRIAPLPPMVVSTRQSERFDLPIILSPNPVRDLLRVELPGEVAGAGLSIDVVDDLGRVLRTVNEVSTINSVDMMDLPSGVYTLTVRDGRQLVGRARFLVVR